VYAVGYRELGREGLWRAAVMASGPEAALSHAEAAADWRMTRAPSGPVAITVPGRSGRATRRGIDLHRAPLPPEDVVVHDGLRVTSPARTLIDLAALLPTRDLECTLDEAHYLNRVSTRTLAETLQRNRGRPGCAPLRALLADHELGSTRTATALEERFLQGLRRAGLPDPYCQQWIGRHRVDFLWPAERVIGETDGWAAHRGRRRQARDARRDEELAARGYEVVRVEEAEVDERLDQAVERVAVKLSARRPSPAG
jgi:very-short-patch-repair endonuclease